MDHNSHHASSNPMASPYPQQHHPQGQQQAGQQQQMQHGQTLPPLQPHDNGAPMFSNYGQPQQNTTQQQHISSYPPPPTNAGRGTYPMVHNSYPPPHPSYATSGPPMPQTSLPTSHPQPIAPAPLAGGRIPPVLRPMPPGETNSSMGLPSPYDSGSLLPSPAQTGLLDNGELPTHVVGSQGRRGILPTAPGRPAPAQPGTAMAKNQVPQKDADGKFPCPHCTKTYLHAKHLKRHLLRHTGDRPYMCVLCRDTFSRSDILKRHFQKCSIRRGNPTGASHLSHPHAHVKKGQEAQGIDITGNDHHGNHGNGVNPAGGQGDPMAPFGMLTTADPVNQLATASDQSHLSRGSSMGRLDDPSGQDRSGVPTPVMAHAPYAPATPTSLAGALNPQLASYGMPSGPNGMHMYHGQTPSQSSSLDWAQMFPQGGAQDTFISQYSSNSGQTQTATKAEPEQKYATVAPGASIDHAHRSGSLFFDDDKIRTSSANDPYQQLSTQILRFFYPPEVMMSDQNAGMNFYFSPSNVEDFLNNYRHFHQHWAILHLPTFQILDAYTGLIASMCCIGACYSNLVSADHVRDMMDFVKIALERDSRMLAGLETHSGLSLTKKDDTEEVQALMLVHVLHLWNGDPQQRSNAGPLFSKISSLARGLGLTQIATDLRVQSPLHRPKAQQGDISAAQFDWTPWIEQEKRIRVMHGILNMDVALGLYFNVDAQFDVFEIQIPLPCDDAAWDATDAKTCAQSLGLCGSEAAKGVNPDGTQRARQPELHLFMQTILDPAYQIRTGVTNMLGKFIISHAILALFRRAQIAGTSISLATSVGAWPPNDWAFVTSPYAIPKPEPGAVDERGAISAQNISALSTALDKFKHNWDVDVVTQHPPTSQNPRRYGFSKDAIHFYWLAMYMLRNTRPSDLLLAPDLRFIQVINMLKSVKTWVLTDGAARGEHMGSVGEIDQDYGSTNLTLNMTSLFKPIPAAVASTAAVGVKQETV